MSRNDTRTHTGGKATAPEPVFWVKIKRFDQGGRLQGHEEFTHPSWDMTLDRLTRYVKKMATSDIPGIAQWKSFEILITPSEE